VNIRIVIHRDTSFPAMLTSMSLVSCVSSGHVRSTDRSSNYVRFANGYQLLLAIIRISSESITTCDMSQRQVCRSTNTIFSFDGTTSYDFYTAKQLVHVEQLFIDRLMQSVDETHENSSHCKKQYNRFDQSMNQIHVIFSCHRLESIRMQLTSRVNISMDCIVFVLLSCYL
jgi:hypothetical protein